MSRKPGAVQRALSAIRFRQQRQEEAALLAERAMAKAPDCPHTMTTLGIARMAGQRLDEADVLFQRAIAAAQLAEAHANRAVLLMHRRDIDAAIFHGEAAVARKPFLVNSWRLLARLYQERGRCTDAIRAIEQTTQLEPDNPLFLIELGETYRVGSQLENALATLNSAVIRFPNLASAWANLGLAQQVASRHDEALASYVKALAIDPGLGDVHNNMGTIFLQAGDIRRAMFSFEQACRYFPGRADLQANLGIVALRAGEEELAFEAIKKSLNIKELPQAKGAFVQCVKQLGCIPKDDENQSFVVRAMLEPWGRPGDLAAACMNMLKQDQAFVSLVSLVGRVLHSWPVRLKSQELWQGGSPDIIFKSKILRCLLESVPVCDLGLEKLLITIRKNLLDEVTSLHHHHKDVLQEPQLAFYCSMAQQCFVNGYVFEPQDEESEKVESLRDDIVCALNSAGSVSVAELATLASYIPLHELPGADLFLERPWPDPAKSLLAIQIREPLEERRLRAEARRLTAIDDEVSILVQKQYEENPYPRWTRLPATRGNIAVDDYMRQAFPLASFCQANKIGETAEILIAGCGTGQHSIETAQRFRKSRVLAVDLSLASLGYAMRKSQELSLDNIIYAQADILRIEEIDRQFDVIESVGVVHHLRDPMVGLDKLSKALKTGGFIRLGLYSEKSRQDIISARDFIEQRGFKPNNRDIRRCRQELMALADVGPMTRVTNRRDFFEMNSCRDLLFHCQEHRFTIPQVKLLLANLNLIFIGFILESPAISEAYLSRFPQDAGMLDLDAWDIFEAENPQTFKSMYQFWAQKEAVG